MFERFTDQARATLVRAKEEARGRGHEHIGTEHLLLGLLSDEQGVGVRALRSLGIEPETIRADVEETVGRADMDAWRRRTRCCARRSTGSDSSSPAASVRNRPPRRGDRTCPAGVSAPTSGSAVVSLRITPVLELEPCR